MEQVIKNPLTVEIERINKSFMISFTFKDDEPLLMETSVVDINILVNDSFLVGIDSPETFETYFGWNIKEVVVTTLEDCMYLDIYVKSN